MVPKNLLSYLVGKLVHIRWPKPMAQVLVGIFAKHYKINLSEAEKKLSHYRSIGEFFIRKIKMELRPLGEGAILHPADALITEIQQIRSGELIQAKGIHYSLAELLADSKKAQSYEGGLFATYYLCPTDYHRVHSPVSGQILSAKHIPGNLWPVNEWSTRRIPSLFAINERVVVEIASDYGPIQVILVGATNVGKISLSFDKEILTNQSHVRPLVEKKYVPSVPIKKGDELGIFHMGSTVIVIFPPSIQKQLNDWSTFRGQKTLVRSTFL